MNIVTLKDESGTPKYKHIIASIEDVNVNGILIKGCKLSSLNSIKNPNALSRDSVCTAFNELKTCGIVQSIIAKGYFVMSENRAVNQKIIITDCTH